MSNQTTLINNTSYEISGGRTLINDTGYDIQNGRTLIDSVGYDILFDEEPEPEIEDLNTYIGALESIRIVSNRFSQKIDDNHICVLFKDDDNNVILQIFLISDNFVFSLLNEIILWNTTNTINGFYYKDGVVAVQFDIKFVYGFELDLNNNTILKRKAVNLLFVDGKNPYRMRSGLNNSVVMPDRNHAICALCYNYDNNIRIATGYLQIINFNFDEIEGASEGVTDTWRILYDATFGSGSTADYFGIFRIEIIDGRLFAAFSERNKCCIATATFSPTLNFFWDKQKNVDYIGASGYVNPNDYYDSFNNLYFLKDGTNNNYIYTIGIFNKFNSYSNGRLIYYSCYDFINNEVIYKKQHNYNEYQSIPFGYEYTMNPNYDYNSSLHYLTNNEFIIFNTSFYSFYDGANEKYPFDMQNIFSFDFLNGELIFKQNSFSCGVSYSYAIDDNFVFTKITGTNRIKYKILAKQGGIFNIVNIYSFSEDNPLNISNYVDISLKWYNYHYTGTTIKPLIDSITLTLTHTNLTSDYYDIVYPPSSAYGDVELIFNFKGIFTGSTSIPFYIDNTQYTPEFSNIESIDFDFFGKNDALPARYSFYLKGIITDQNGNYFGDLYDYGNDDNLNIELIRSPYYDEDTGTDDGDDYVSFAGYSHIIIRIHGVQIDYEPKAGNYYFRVNYNTTQTSKQGILGFRPSDPSNVTPYEED